MKKILFFIPTLGHGGAERVLVNLVNHMDQTQFDITVQTMFDVGIYKDKLAEGIQYIGGFPWYFRGNTLAYKLFSPARLYKMYIRQPYDIIVSFLEGPSARVIGGCTDENTTLISWIHVVHPSEKYVCDVFRSMEEAQRCYEKFDRTICVADTVRKNFESLFHLPTPAQVLYNVVETDVIRKRGQEPVTDLVFSSQEINLCSVAKLIKVKGYDRLIPIVARLRACNLPVHLYLIGKGEEEHALRQLAKEQGIENYVTFVGFRENPYQYVAASDLYVCSSYREGFSTAVTEALIVGTPVVSTNCSGAVELLGTQNEFGIVTENDAESLYEGIKKMLTTDGLLQHYRTMAAERGNHFSTEQTVNAVETMLKEAAK